MSRSNKLPHLVAYDIADPKRLQRVHRYLKKIAIPLQYSVFMTLMSTQDCDRLINQLADLIVPTEDDIRIYPLPQKPEWAAYGKALWAEGIMLTEIALPHQQSTLE